MTGKERYMAAVRMQPVDRLPFWPKVFAGYIKDQSDPFNSLTVEELLGYIGSERQTGLPEHIRRTGARSAESSFRKNGVLVHEFTLGKLSRSLVQQYDAATLTYHPVDFPVKSPDDLDFFAEWYADGVYSIDEDGLEKQKNVYDALGGAGATAYSIGESPLMYFLEYMAGIANGHYLLADHVQKTETLFEEIHRAMLRRCELARATPYADLLYFTENTSTTLISPSQYVRYCKGHIDDYGAALAPGGKPFVLHMCGHLKKLLPILAESAADAFEAFTPPSVGDATLSDGRAACPGKALIGGTNAVIWLWEPDAIIEYIYNALDKLPHTRGLVLSSAGVMPPAAKPGTIKKVYEAVKEYRVRN